MTSYTITITTDDRDESLIVYGEMRQLYGTDHDIGWYPSDADDDDDDDDEPTDDEAAADIDSLLGTGSTLQTLDDSIRHAVTSEMTIDEAIAALRALQRVYSGSNEAMRYIDRVIEQMSTATGDHAPANGIERPLIVTPDAKDERSKQIKTLIRDKVACPSCGAGVNQWCISASGAAYYASMMHADRILAYQAL